VFFIFGECFLGEKDLHETVKVGWSDNGCGTAKPTDLMENRYFTGAWSAHELLWFQCNIFVCLNQRLFHPKELLHAQMWGTFLHSVNTCLNNFLKFHNFCRTFNSREERPVSKHLSAQGRPDPRGGLCCVCFTNRTWTPLIAASGTLQIVENWLKLRMLQPLKVEGVKNSKKKTHRTLQSRFLSIQKIRCMLLCHNYSFKMICRTEGGAPIEL
jgi:hypothetical protein